MMMNLPPDDGEHVNINKYTSSRSMFIVEGKGFDIKEGELLKYFEIKNHATTSPIVHH